MAVRRVDIRIYTYSIHISRETIKARSRDKTYTQDPDIATMKPARNLDFFYLFNIYYENVLMLNFCSATVHETM